MFPRTSHSLHDLLANLVLDPVPGVWFELWTDGPLTPPYNDAVAIMTNDIYLVMDRKSLAAEVYGRFSWRIQALPPRARPQPLIVDMSGELERFDLPIPAGWLLPANAPQTAWMTEAELAYYGPTND